MTSLRVTQFTAEPLLRLLLGMRGHDAEFFSVTAAWDAFKQFVSLPTDLEDLGVTFQVYPSEGAQEFAEIEPVQQFELFFGRRLRDPHSALTYERTVGIHMLLEAPTGAVGAHELWSYEGDDLAELYTQVEALSEFRIAAEAPVVMVTFVCEDE